jgi:hypothetical protein
MTMTKKDTKSVLDRSKTKVKNDPITSESSLKQKTDKTSVKN